MHKKKQVLIVAVIIVLLGTAFVWWYVVSKNQDKKCVAPNDAIVSCDALRQNPTKTDWWSEN